MNTTDSISLWKERITSRKLSGMKVNDWCEQNGLSRHAYYYWHHKLKGTSTEQINVFEEVLMPPVQGIPDTKKDENYGLMISWKDITVHVTDPQAVPMAAELLSRLVKQC